MKINLFQFCDHCWVFQICWHIECNILTWSYFRILNSSAGIWSPPLALFVVMLPMAHLTLHSKMFSSGWVTSPPWLSGSLRSFLYSSSVYFCHLFLIYSASVRSYYFYPLLCPSLHEVFLWYLITWKRSLVFPILLSSSISLHCSLKKAFLFILATSS